MAERTISSKGANIWAILSLVGIPVFAILGLVQMDAALEASNAAGNADGSYKTASEYNHKIGNAKGAELTYEIDGDSIPEFADVGFEQERSTGEWQKIKEHEEQLQKIQKHVNSHRYAAGTLFFISTALGMFSVLIHWRRVKVVYRDRSLQY